MGSRGEDLLDEHDDQGHYDFQSFSLLWPFGIHLPASVSVMYDPTSWFPISIQAVLLEVVKENYLLKELQFHVFS